MPGLRERKKRQREKTILEAAEKLFRESGYDSTTMGHIADAANVSTVTVFNYYKTKGELLLALISNENAVLLEKLGRLSKSKRKNIEGLISDFFKVVVEESLRQVDKSLWRHIISTSMLNHESDFSSAYRQLQGEILDLLRVTVAGHFASNSKKDVSHKDLIMFCNVIYSLHYMEFCNFISSDALTIESYSRSLEKMISFSARALPSI